MRILLSTDPEIEVPPKLYGGIERIVDGLARRLMTRGHKICLVAKPGSSCPVDVFQPWPGQKSQSRLDTVRNALTLGRAIRSFRPDVIHSFSRIAYLTPHLRGRIPIVMTYQRDPTPRTVNLAVKLAAPGVLTFTGCSEYIASCGRKTGGTWLGIPNFADMDSLKFSPSVAADAPLVFLSRVESIKGAHWAIEIARRTGRRLLIAGNHADSGPEGDYWTKEIEPWIGRDGIEYVGPVDDTQKNRVLGQALAMVVPIQWNEPFGIVFAESLACGTPIISCPRGSLPEIVRQGIDGFLINSIEEGCEAVGKLHTIDRASCRRRAEEHYAPDVVVGRYLDLYQQVRAGLRTT
ncbi:Glycosyltransferase involved in cell wall bisynthesis [Enhydrobacter aerosaccus]|uniref:Glycosyltransferase involved in cell wall bisynthesis n=1 Tax=Enhydrobacter aerosaccus TaxID=225324 RepID=A0A1T4T9U7_9HYPH|nr:glycosyltransferase [Enhydrobacter aerosaccus]SKA37206.1 Glycosyltransferase involved in cell wall bisynthesis [Enhydrobacter aerosaccus]